MSISQSDQEWIETVIGVRQHHYETSSIWNYWPWRWCQVVAILGSVAAGIAATAISMDFQWLKWVSVAASAIATIASTLMSTIKFREFYHIRELGVIFTRDIRTQAINFFSVNRTDDERTQFMDRVASELKKLEYDQLNLAKAVDGPAHPPTRPPKIG